MIGRGVGEIELTVIAPPPTAEPALFAVQVGAFRDRANAERAEQDMTAAYGAATAVETGNPVVWRVLAGRESSQEAAEVLARRIREERNVREAFVVRLDP